MSAYFNSLKHIFQSGKPARFKKGETILRAEAHSKEIYILETGIAYSYTYTYNGRKDKTYTLSMDRATFSPYRLLRTMHWYQPTLKH